MKPKRFKKVAETFNEYVKRHTKEIDEFWTGIYFILAIPFIGILNFILIRFIFYYLDRIITYEEIK